MRYSYNKCKRRGCKFYTADCRNHCAALSQVYEKDSQCPFFKKKEGKE